jgi:signal transduction histidine kinase
MDHVEHPAHRTPQRAGRVGGLLDGLDGRRDLALPAVLVVVQLAGAAATLAGHHSPSGHLGPADWALLVVGPLALVFRRRRPVAVLWVTFAATLTPSGAWSANLSLIVAFFVAATSGHRRAAWVVIVFGYLSAVWLAPLAYGNPVGSLTFALALAGWLAVLVIAAEVVRLRRERTIESRAARALDARRRASEERLQMARDLHDVIGHNISLINVQAGVGLDLMDTHPEQARTALAAIKAVSKDALDELRSMLGALRQGDEDAPRDPAPGLDRLDRLVEQTRAAGIARHAGRATATVRLAHGPDGLDVEIRDDGCAPANESFPGSGSGIAGMRQRANALGGRLEAGPCPGGGFVVHAHLPLGDPS